MNLMKYLLVVFIILYLSCGQSEKKDGNELPSHTSKTTNPTENNIVALVDSKPIFKNEIDKRDLKYVINDRIFYEEALRQRLDKEEDIQSRLDEYKKILIIREAIRQNPGILNRSLASNPKDAENFIKTKRTKNTKPEAVKKEVKVDDMIYKEGLKRGLDKDKIIQKPFENFKRNLVTNEFKKKLIPHPSTLDKVSQEEIENYFEGKKSKFTKLDLELLIIEDRKIAEEMHKLAISGEDFKTLFDKYQQNGSNSNIKFRKLFYNNRSYNLFNEIKVGSVSDIIIEGNKFKILKIKNIRLDPISKVKSLIEFYILMKKRDDALANIANEFKEKNNIKIEILSEDGTS